VSLLALAIVPASGCVTGATCVDGYVTESGACEAQCVADKCKPGNVCVANRCVLPCTDHTDCAYGSDCVAATGDAGEDIRLCEQSKRRAPFVDPAVNAAPGGYGWPCPFGDASCSCPYGDAECVGATLACPNGLECDPAACADCAPDPDVCGGDPLCNVGRCGDGSPCTFNTCDLTQCTPFVCVGAGIGDARAYCSRHDCASDEECPTGFYCGITRDPHDICGNTCDGGTCSHDPSISCTSDGQCQKGNNNFCGETVEPCLDLAAANAAGTTHFEGGVCALRRTCLKREDCVRCEDNFDCSLGEAQVCGVHGGQNVCLRICNSQTDCRLDESCVPYVPASGGTGGTCFSDANIDCETPDDCPADDDTCVPRDVCVPAAGRCDASDSVSKFCRHCVDDEDCGGADKPGRWGCVEVSNGEYGCLDLSFPNACDSDDDCPISPAGRHGECITDSSSSLFRRCYAPFCDPLDAENPCTDLDKANRYTCN
jgi:hypothetical protein